MTMFNSHALNHHWLVTSAEGNVFLRPYYLPSARSLFEVVNE